MDNEIKAPELTPDDDKTVAIEQTNNSEEQYSLNDDRRVKVLSPGMLVAKRFLRNRIAVTGLIILAFMFAFSFIGGIISPYSEDQLFYRYDMMNKTYASVVKNEEFRYTSAPEADFSSILQAQLVLAVQTNKEEVSYRDVTYKVEKLGNDLYEMSLPDVGPLGLAYKDIVSPSTKGGDLPYEVKKSALVAYSAGDKAFSAQGKDYTIDDDGVVYEGGEEQAYISRYVVNPAMGDIFLTRDFKEALTENINNNDPDFKFTSPDGTEAEYKINYDPATKVWDVTQSTATRVFNSYASPSLEHLLGTDRNGMDMLTRLMYGGRVSLMIGFIVEIIATVLGIIMGGVAGYCGKAVDMLIMRIVDIFYCIPSMPIIIILGAVMDASGVESKIRMIYLMLILGFLGWPSVARMVRGQILSLREQEFMTATEACGIRTSRRIFRHLVPNVIPQIIVSCTMGLGSTIITEATLSFLGLGVKFPFASWGNIINDVNDVYVLTNYWFIWIPAGTLLLLTVLAFNLVGDGLRDAFDPKMKR